MREKKIEAKKLHAMGFSMRQIAKVLGVSHPTISRWLKEDSTPRADPYIQLYKRTPHKLKSRLKALLELSSSEKGRSRVLSKKAIFRRLELDLSMLGISSYHKFCKYLEVFIREEYGSKEKLEKKRRPRKELPRYHTPKGSVIREPAVVEIDATGYTVGDRLYTILLAIDTYSMHFFEPMVVENKTKDIKHYNKAINGYDLAEYLIHIFSEYGLPYALKYDGDKVMNNELISRGLKRLGVRTIRAYLPNQKVIERAFRDIKDELRYLTHNVQERELVFEKIADAVNTYNMREHTFKHLGNRPVIPQELFSQLSHHYSPVSEDELRKAFREEAIRTVRNNTVQWDGSLYEVHLIDPYRFEPHRLGEYGRKRSAPKVLCTRDIDNLVRIELFDLRTGEYLGEGRLVSVEEVLSPSEKKELKNKRKRVLRRARKIDKELSAIEESLQEQTDVRIESSASGSLEDLMELAQEIEEEEIW